jgi:small conductance mechanosensitive channel
MSLASILIQFQNMVPDTAAVAAAKHANVVHDTITSKIDSVARNITNPDSLANLTPEKLTTKIKNFDWTGVIDKLTNDFVTLGLRIVAAIVIFYVGKLIINKIHQVLRTIMIRRNIDRSLTTFVLSFVKISLLCVLLIMVISVLGIQTSSFIAIFATAGIAIGMAMSGTLQNFAGGVLILLLKPYQVGDYITFGEYHGFVKEIQIFNTIITTYDNELIVIPNGGLSTGTVKNFTQEKHHRLEWRVSIAYGDNVETAREVALNILNEEPKIIKKYVDESFGLKKKGKETADAGDDVKKTKRSLWNRMFGRNKALQAKTAAWMESREKILRERLPKKDYTPYIAVEKLDSSSVVIVIRAWAATDDYWSLFYSINEKIYTQFPLHGLHFPYPQMDVTLKK